MGRRPLSSYNSLELAEHKESLSMRKIDQLFEYDSDDAETIKKLVTSIEGTDAYWYLISKLVVQSRALAIDLERAQRDIEELKEINDKMCNSFKKNTNDYDY